MSGSLVRTVVVMFTLLLGQLWSPPAHATLDQCKGFGVSGKWECTTTPLVLTPWQYGIPGPIKGVQHFNSAEAAIDAYKAVVAANVGSGLCSGPSANMSSTRGADDQPTGWDFKRLYTTERFALRVAFGVRTGSGAPNDPYVCNPREIATIVVRYRNAYCDQATGWGNYYDDPRSHYCARADTPEDRSCPTANPVLPGSGVKLLHSTDYTGAGAHPLQFSRVYRSRWARAEFIATMGGVANAAGRAGWLHSYERQVAEVPFAPTAMRRVVRPDGSVNTFTATPDAQGVVQWKAEPGVRDSLLPTPTGWQYKVFADDAVERYDATGRLLSITERNGWLTTLSYSDATTPVDVAPKPGLLIRVANHFGRALTFSYEQNGRLAALIDPAGGALRLRRLWQPRQRHLARQHQPHLSL
jgi:YD repeat-containing protein